MLSLYTSVVEPLSFRSRQDPLRWEQQGSCLYLVCQGQSQSLKQSQEKYPDLLTLCVCHRAASSSLSFWLPVECVL